MPSIADIVTALQQQPSPSTVDFLWWHWPTDEFAAWGQWAGGIGAIGAVFVTLWIMRRDRRKHQREMLQQAHDAAVAQASARREEEERHAARARTVVAGPKYESDAKPGVVYKELPWSSHGVEIANYSNSPVLEVVLESLELRAADGSVHESWHAQDLAQENLPRQVAAVIAPGEGQLVDSAAVARVWPHIRSGQTTLWATFTFLDIEGYRWRRVGSGAPQLIKGTAPTS